MFYLAFKPVLKRLITVGETVDISVMTECLHGQEGIIDLCGQIRKTVLV